MNQLSWLLYWADALPSLATFIAILSFLIFLGSGFMLLLGITNAFGDEDNDNPMMVRFRRMWWLPTLAFLMWGASFLVPSKETFYLIAASEMGEKAIQTPEFVKLRGVLNKFLDGQLDEDKDTTEDK